MTPRRRSPLLRLALVGGALAVGAAVANAALWAVGFEYRPLSIARGRGEFGQTGAAANFIQAEQLFTSDDFVFDPDLVWRPRPGASVFNAQGYRGPVLPAEKPPGEFRVLAVGDSNTLGFANTEGAHWPRYLQALLPEPRFRVVNAGVWGYSSFQGLARLREAMALRPDLVLVSFGANDAHRVHASDREFAGRVGRVRALERFRLGHLALRLLDRGARADAERWVPRVPLEEYRANLAEMVRLARAGGAACVLLTRPFVGGSPDPRWWKNFAPGYNAATLEVAAAEGVPSIDVHAHFAGRDELFGDESHFWEIGHRAAGALLHERLRPLLPPHETPGEGRRFEPGTWPERVRGFHPSRTVPEWTDGDATIEPAGLRLRPGDAALVVETWGWHPRPAEAGLAAIADGVELPPLPGPPDRAYRFSLAPLAGAAEIRALRLRSSTFVPRALGLGDDDRALGVDVRAVGLE